MFYRCVCDRSRLSSSSRRPASASDASARASAAYRRTSSSTTCSYAYAPTTCCCALVHVRAGARVVRARPPRVRVARVAEERGVLDLLERAGHVQHRLRPARREGASDLLVKLGKCGGEERTHDVRTVKYATARAQIGALLARLAVWDARRASLMTYVGVLAPRHGGREAPCL